MKLPPYLVLGLFLGIPGLLARGAQEAAPPRRPNVLVIITDDQRWDAIGLAGNKYLKTPNMDRLGKEGIYFKNAFCTTSLCSPSRASILSGRHSFSHGVTDNFTDYPTAIPSFPGILQGEGYDTAYIGKWHMGEDNDQPRPGFNWFVTHRGQGSYYGTKFNINGQRIESPSGYYTTVVTDMAEDWINRDREGKPWLLMVGHKAPHSFYVPEEKYQNAFDGVRINYPDTAFMLDDKPQWIRDRLTTWHGIYGPLFEWRKKYPDKSPGAVKDFEAMVHAYWGTLLSVDDSVGRLYELLKKRGELDNTIIVFMSDNGLLEGEDGMVDKRTAHEGSMRIVQVVRFPSLTPPLRPKTVGEQVLTVDIAPSILELCGAKVPAGVQGRSWVQLVRHGDPAWRTSWFYYYNYEKQFPYTPNIRAVRTASWKYIHYPHGDNGPDRHMAELYHLAVDPGERVNLINDPNHAKALQEMKKELGRAMLAAGLDSARDRMPLDEGIKQKLPEVSIR